jgi:hypothetical protein
MAGHETADVGATSFSTMTVSTMKAPLIFDATSLRKISCGRSLCLPAELQGFGNLEGACGIVRT